MLRKLYNYYFSPDRFFARQLKQVLGFTPQYLHFYQRAFTHKSLSKSEENSSGKIGYNNERLEFLGDAVLDAVTAEYLFRKYPTQDEGFLTQMRSKLVNRKTLNKIASDIHLDSFLQQFGINNVSQSMLGNAFEAFVGAVYLDAGFDKTKKFIINRILRRFVDVHELENTQHNYKSLLLEHCQRLHQAINYEVLEHYRSKNNREKFKISVKIGDKQLAIAEDFSKKSAEQSASRKALVILGLLNDENDEPIIPSNTAQE